METLMKSEGNFKLYRGTATCYAAAIREGRKKKKVRE
jgi:hypothetical protein